MKKYYLITWNARSSFEVIVSDGTHQKFPSDEVWEYHGQVEGSLGGWDSAMNKFITPKLYDKPKYEMMFDPTKYEAKDKSGIAKDTIKFIFEKFKV